MTRRRVLILVLLTAAIVAALAYLRDPPWLLSMTSGLHQWQTDERGTRYRWMAPHASFFVPSNATQIDIPLRAPIDSPADWPIVATITVDDRLVDRLVLRDSSWRRSSVRMPASSGRRVQRLDIRLDRTRDRDRGARVGEIVVR